MKSSSALPARFSFYAKLSIEGERESRADEILSESISKLQKSLTHSSGRFDWVSNIHYKFENIPQRGLTSRGLVRLNPNGLTEWTIVHELAHAWDASVNWQLSERMRKATHSHFWFLLLHKRWPNNPRFWYHVGNPPPPCGVDKNFNAKEDFAETVTAYLFPEEAYRRATKRKMAYESFGFVHFHDTPRGKFIKALFEQKM